MPVVALANPKGGVGKSTSALVLSTTLARLGFSVSVVDADPRRVLVDWKTQGRSATRVTVIGDVSERTVVSAIEDAAARDQLVFVDLEGAASRLVSRAVSRADLVVVPMQAAALDARAAADVLAMIAEEEQVYRRPIACRVLFTRTNPLIVTRIERSILAGLRDRGIAHFKTHLSQRQAYNAMFVQRLALDELTPREVSGLEQARENAVALAREVVEVLARVVAPAGAPEEEGALA